MCFAFSFYSCDNNAIGDLPETAKTLLDYFYYVSSEDFSSEEALVKCYDESGYWLYTEKFELSSSGMSYKYTFGNLASFENTYIKSDSKMTVSVTGGGDTTTIEIGGTSYNKGSDGYTTIEEEFNAIQQYVYLEVAKIDMTITIDGTSYYVTVDFKEKYEENSVTIEEDFTLFPSLNGVSAFSIIVSATDDDNDGVYESISSAYVTIDGTTYDIKDYLEEMIQAEE